MILLIGIPSEPPIALAAEALQRAGAPYALLNQRDVVDHEIDVRCSAGRVVGRLRMADRSVSLDAISAIYVRLTDHRVLPEREHLDDDHPDARHIDDFHQRLVRLLDVIPATVVNRIDAMGSNSSKPYQTELIRRCGLATPTTLITGDPAQARTFIDRHHGNVIFKSVSGVRSIVRRVTPDDLDRLELIRACPAQFQAFVPGDDVRVHVVGDEVIATRIRSDADDYRYARLEATEAALEPFDLPPELADRCRTVTRALGLEFSGVDLRLDDNRAVCFEVNPSPAYSYYEANTGQPISEALAVLLQRTERVAA